MAIRGSFQVPVTHVPLETEERSNNNLIANFLAQKYSLGPCERTQFMYPST